MFTKLKGAIKLISLLCFFLSANAIAVSQAQIEQFKRMPQAQQQALAKSMGVDLNSIEAMTGSFDKPKKPEPTKSYPRGTNFDDEGEPTFEGYDFQSRDNEEHRFTQALKPFGYDVFSNAPSTFAPITDIAIPSGYILGSGDSLTIQVFGKEDAEHQLIVSREGTITIPKVGPVKVAGLTFSEMKTFIAQKVKERIVGVDVIVNLDELRSMRIFVLGDAYQPGPYILSSLSSISHALFAAGGISDIGSLRNIQLKRAGKLITTFDSYDLLIRGDSSNDLMLESGDVIYVTSVGSRVTIEGEVKRPAIYELAKGETIADVLTMAGGLLPSAYLKSSIVDRYSENNYRSAIDVDLTNKSETNQQVKAGDHIRVKKSSDLYEKSITLIGALVRPGKYQWESGKKITDIIPEIDSHLLLHADLNYSLIVREVDITRNVEILQFSLAKAINEPSSVDNIELKVSDKVIVFSNVTTIFEEKVALDNLAHTQENLFKLEKMLAKEKFESDQFWKKYGIGLDSVNNPGSNYLNASEAEKTRFVNQSIARITGGEYQEENDIREVSLFSRQRLLTPIIAKLKAQGSPGRPIQLVEIDGQVKHPGVYPLAKNARISDLVIAAGGDKESAYLERAEITRNVIEGIQARKVSYNIELSKALAGDKTANILLKSKDRLNIHKIPSWSQNHVVELRGEFVFPGKYTIRRGESLSDIVKKAGGLTEYAHAQGSVFSREKLKELERQNLIKISTDLRLEMASKALSEQGLSTSYNEANSLLEDMAKIAPVGRLVIELPRIMEDDEYDVLLEGGDILYVPTKANTINVIGQVQVTTSHVYDNNMNAHEYIAQSGGMKIRADESRVYIISASGRIKMLDNGNWFAGSSSLKPGDTIVVPLDSEYRDNITLWTSATSIIYQSAVAVAAIAGIRN